MAETGWIEIASVASDSEPGVVHVIKRHTDGRTGCSCLSYRFARKEAKTCKHIEAVAKGGFWADPAWQAAREGHASVRGETFTVRRAISFGALPSH